MEEVERVEDERGKIEKKFSIKDRIKKIKHLDIIIASIVLIFALMLYFGGMESTTKIKKLSPQDDNFKRELEDVLSSINGVGKVNVIIRYSDNQNIEIAYKEQSVTKVDKDGTISVIESSKDPIIVRDSKGDKPIIIKKDGNDISGVIVVCKGGANPKVRVDITEALTTLLKVDSYKIRVYEMK